MVEKKSGRNLNKLLDQQNSGDDLGRAAIYESDLSRALGTSPYPSDLYSEDCLSGIVVRSPHPHCIIKQIDTSKALAVPGVVCIVLEEDIPGKKFVGKLMDDMPVLVGEGQVAHSVLDAVCLVAAENEDSAREAAELVKIDIEALEAIFTAEDALKPDAVEIHEGGNIAADIKIRHGDIEKGFEEADVIIEKRYQIPGIDHAFMETEAAFAEPLKDGIRISVGSQNPYLERMLSAKILDLSEDQVEIVDVHAGGGFGGKDDSMVTLYCGLLAWKSQKAVRMYWSRAESLRGHCKRHPMWVIAKTGATNDGRLTAMQMEITADTGSYAHYGPAILKFASLGANGVYSIPNSKVDTKVVYTNNVVSGAMRAWGNQAIAFVVESQIDQLARKLNIHPLRFRWLNVLQDGGVMISGQAPPPRVGAKATIEAAAAHLGIDLENVQPDIGSGIGFATVMQGVNYHFGYSDSSEVRIEVGEDGVFEVYAATSDIGQGLEAEIRLLFSRALGGLPIERVRWMPQSTHTSPDAGSTGASRHTCTTGNAMWGASMKIRKQLQSVAAEILDTSPDQVEVCGERLVDGEKEVSLSEVLTEAKKSQLEIKAGYKFIAPPTTDIDENGQGFPVNQYSYETLISQVEVAKDTGEVTVRQMDAFVDAGRIINPMGAAKQVEGGSVMGLGYALTEEFLQKEGTPWTDSLATYLIPTVIDSPPVINSTFVDEAIPFGEIGGRGLAEVVVVAPAPSIINAIADATDVYVTRIPATAERVLKAIETMEED